MSPPAAPASEPVLPDEILEDIFLRLDSFADLACASAACTDFRRVVSARRFRRRLRSLRPAPVLGLLELDATVEFRPAEPPHRSAPAARALAQAADFTFSFLPGSPNDWRACDARDGRVLLYSRVSCLTKAFADLVVCDPLHRRYVQLPPIPDDLAPATGCCGYRDFDPVLDPVTDGEKEEEQDLPFRVICAVQCQHEFVSFHLSSATRKWHCIRFDWFTPLDHTMVNSYQWFEREYAHGCFYWRLLGMGTWFILDTHEMKFSVLDQLPGTDADHQTHEIVEVGEDRLVIVNVDDGILEFHSKPWGNKNSGVHTEWQHDKMIPLPRMDCYWRILSTAEGYLFLRATPKNPSFVHPATLESQYFTLDLKTLLIERLCVSNQHNRVARLYASFPPSLSLPSI